MDQAQPKALAALQPFIIEATSTKSPSPRFLKELIIRATSASGTYIFTELLQTQAIQSLQTADPEYKSYLTQLEHFSWGTYEEYKSTQGLPDLTPVQTQKLRQLSLLSLASPFLPTQEEKPDTLTYPALLSSLGLSSNHELESLITSAIYAGLLTARLSPTSTPPRVLVTSVAPLRDLRPQSLPAILQILKTWENRCSTTIYGLESQIATIRAGAADRTALQRKRQEVVDTAVIQGENDSSKPVRPRDRRGNKRDLDERMEGEDDEDVSSDEVKMEVDDGADVAGPAGPRGGGFGGRGTKRNRGRGALGGFT
ncbi:hypothetical protein PMZ80_002435 [Knufia obscura]|uniref:PCI domain-containing protein n=2 Tax=Knufia TaxID=430999 RepID=A0AAN8I5U4_9EURO|nr:hypothetical protein PMZ80_002435 [Knufia obscura]KAK5950856.1 hypothetical protein OHC33_008239 [Knufia fluminis]